jgi:ATP-dependent exoDNAse (exonuclease V) beta subunit
VVPADREKIKAGTMKFTASQATAIGFSTDNLQLIACAGSGKTEVVARRVVHLLQADGGRLLPRNMDIGKDYGKKPNGVNIR